MAQIPCPYAGNGCQELFEVHIRDLSDPEGNAAADEDERAYEAHRANCPYRPEALEANANE